MNTVYNVCFEFNRLGHAKQNYVFEHAQNAQIQIIPHMHKVSSRAQLFQTNDVVS